MSKGSEVAESGEKPGEASPTEKSQYAGEVSRVREVPVEGPRAQEVPVEGPRTQEAVPVEGPRAQEASAIEGPPANDSRPVDPLIARAKERIGAVLRDKWRLDELLGVGGMAAVYAATHRNGSRAAVKVLHAGMSTNPLVRPRFLSEGYLANAVGHEGAVKVIDDDEAEDGSLFLVTELLDGETIEERRLRLGGRLPVDEVLLATDQLLSVLMVAHAKGMVHRDLKPENLFLTRAGQVKVLDFGIARLREMSGAGAETGDLVGGTPAYMAPEQARGLSDAVDERSDLWACGATMFCLLSGRPVNEGTTSIEQLANAISRPAPLLQSILADVEAPVARIVDRALEFSKEARWPSAEAMQQALRETYQEIAGYPINEAPKLTLSEDAPVRSWGRQGRGPVSQSRGPTTGRPVALPGNLSWRRTVSRVSSTTTRTKTVAIAGVAALGLVLLAGARILGGALSPRAEVMPALPPSQAAGETPPSSEAVVLPPWSPPAVAVTDLPEAHAPARPGASTSKTNVSSPKSGSRSPGPSGASTPSNASPSSSATSSALSRGSRPDCQPPYVVDPATGKKHWKLECL